MMSTSCECTNRLEAHNTDDRCMIQTYDPEWPEQARTSHGALVAREPVKCFQVYALVYSTCRWKVAKTLFP